MKKYWLEFKLSLSDSPPPGTLIGVGITSCCKERAIMEVDTVLFEGNSPEILSCMEIKDIDHLDSNHVIPNMGDPEMEGIWFPLGH